jgi:hypothetical protein
LASLFLSPAAAVPWTLLFAAKAAPRIFFGVEPSIDQ